MGREMIFMENLQDFSHHFLPILGCPNTDMDSRSSIDTLRSFGRSSPWFAKNGNSFTIFPYKFVSSWRRFTKTHDMNKTND